MSGHLLVTGTSGAIGGALARALRARHPRAPMTLVDLHEGPSRALAGALGGDAFVAPCDLMHGDDAQRVLESSRARFGAIAGLVNCAGFMEVRHFESLPWERAEALLAVDLVSPLRLMHASVPDMLERGSGFVVNVTSMAGKVTLRGCAFYGAAKAGLSMASEIAHVELAARGVHVLTVYPGAVASPLEAGARDQYGRTLLTRLIPSGDPSELARRVVRALDTRRARVVYPSLYAVGLLSLASPIALAWGPPAAD